MREDYQPAVAAQWSEIENSIWKLHELSDIDAYSNQYANPSSMGAIGASWTQILMWPLFFKKGWFIRGLFNIVNVRRLPANRGSALNWNWKFHPEIKWTRRYGCLWRPIWYAHPFGVYLISSTKASLLEVYPTLLMREDYQPAMAAQWSEIQNSIWKISSFRIQQWKFARATSLLELLLGKCYFLGLLLVLGKRDKFHIGLMQFAVAKEFVKRLHKPNISEMFWKIPVKEVYGVGDLWRFWSIPNSKWSRTFRGPLLHKPLTELLLDTLHTELALDLNSNFSCTSFF